MKVVSDFILEQFPAWGDAVTTINKIREMSIKAGKDLMPLAEGYIEACFGDEYVDKTAINDFLWFHSEAILAAIGCRVEGGEDDD